MYMMQIADEIVSIGLHRIKLMALEYVINNGKLKMLAYIYTDQLEHSLTDHGINLVEAARNGHLEVLQFLWHRHSVIPIDDIENFQYAFDDAASTGQLKVLEWLSEYV